MKRKMTRMKRMKRTERGLWRKIGNGTCCTICMSAIYAKRYSRS